MKKNMQQKKSRVMNPVLSDTEDELTKAPASSKVTKTLAAASAKKSCRNGNDPSHDHDARANQEILSLRQELELQKKKNAEKDDVISELKKMIVELKDMVSLIKSASVFKDLGTGGGGLPLKSREKENSDQKIKTRDPPKKKVTFAEILREEKIKPSFEIEKIADSKWVGKDFKYLVSLKDGRDLWLSMKDFNAEKLVTEFHEAHPDAATPDDYKLSNGWQTIKKKEMVIKKKLSAKKSLSSQEIDFIALKLTSAPKEPKEFKRVHVQIANKQAISKCSYNQKLNIMRKVIHSYGLAASVVRISFIGSSVMEIYVEADAERRFVLGMQGHGWQTIKDFNFYEIKSFDGKALSEAKKDECTKSLVQRLAYLMAGTKLLKLRQCILEGLEEPTIAAIVEREQEIKEAREGQRTAYVLQRQWCWSVCSLTPTA